MIPLEAAFEVLRYHIKQLYQREFGLSPSGEVAEAFVNIPF